MSSRPCTRSPSIRAARAGNEWEDVSRDDRFVVLEGYRTVVQKDTIQVSGSDDLGLPYDHVRGQVRRSFNACPPTGRAFPRELR
jgi:hypothetical protein